MEKITGSKFGKFTKNLSAKQARSIRGGDPVVVEEKTKYTSEKTGWTVEDVNRYEDNVLVSWKITDMHL